MANCKKSTFLVLSSLSHETWWKKITSWANHFHKVSWVWTKNVNFFYWWTFEYVSFLIPRIYNFSNKTWYKKSYHYIWPDQRLCPFNVFFFFRWSNGFQFKSQLSSLADFSPSMLWSTWLNLLKTFRQQHFS